MNPRLKILEPTTLLTEISAFPAKTALIVTANSGAEVPKATMVRPITKSEIPREYAMCEADVTTQSEPFQSKRMEIIAKGRFTRIMLDSMVYNVLDETGNR